MPWELEQMHSELMVLTGGYEKPSRLSKILDLDYNTK
jgi:hypothetical protein